MSKLTKQYFAIKAKYPDAVLLLRVGDFYETLNEDAEIIAQHMGVTLISTTANPQIKKSASISHYWLDKALQTLVKAGHKVAICDELESPKAAPMQRGDSDLLKSEPTLPQRDNFNF